MTIVAKSGPRLSPVSLEKQLASSVAYNQERWLQLNCVRSDSLPSDYTLAEVHREIDGALSRPAAARLSGRVETPAEFTTRMRKVEAGKRRGVTP